MLLRKRTSPKHGESRVQTALGVYCLEKYVGRNGGDIDAFCGITQFQGIYVLYARMLALSS